MLSKIEGYDSFLREIRHKLHENPELALEETETSKLMEKYLTKWGYEIIKGFAKTDVTAVLKVGTSSKSIGIRADMDALTITEESGKKWSSKIPGKMHACGHDGHTTMLLGLAKYLAETKNFDGTVYLIFQPAEELINGAEIMVKNHYFDKVRCDMIFGMHNMPGYPAGHIYLQEGAYMASMDQFNITVKGRGGHGAMPHLAIDPIVIASHIVLGLQTIISRNTDPLEAAVITVGSIIAGDVANIIPESVEMKVSVRSLNPEVRNLLLTRIPEVACSIAKALGGEADAHHVNGTPVTFNGSEATDFAYKALSKTFDDGSIHYGIKPSMGSEDFSFMLEANPNGSYFFIGNGDTASVHNPHYDFNDEILVKGVKAWATLVESYLK